MTGDVFAAVADPTRRAILGLLAEGERDVSTLAASFPMTQPAISQHLRVLREAGLVRARPAGTRRIYRIEPAGIEELAEWVDRHRGMWSTALDRLQGAAEEGGADG